MRSLHRQARRANTAIINLVFDNDDPFGNSVANAEATQRIMRDTAIQTLLSIVDKLPGPSSKFGGDCTICLCACEKHEKCVALPCHHGFHRACIEQWIRSGRTMDGACPVCKRPLLHSRDEGGEVIVQVREEVLPYLTSQRSNHTGGQAGSQRIVYGRGRSCRATADRSSETSRTQAQGTSQQRLPQRQQQQGAALHGQPPHDDTVAIQLGSISHRDALEIEPPERAQG